MASRQLIPFLYHQHRFEQGTAMKKDGEFFLYQAHRNIEKTTKTFSSVHLPRLHMVVMVSPPLAFPFAFFNFLYLPKLDYRFTNTTSPNALNFLTASC